MQSGLSGAASTDPKIRKNSARPKKSEKPERYTLLNLRATWLISPLDNAIVAVDGQAEDGATREQWTAFVRKYVRLKPEQLDDAWGIMARCDFLNWCEATLPEEKRPRLFSSQEAAEKFRENSVQPKKTEMLESGESAQDWQKIATRDPHLAGHIAARECIWWEGETADSAADSVGLSGESRATFLKSWWESLAELEQEREAAKRQELEQLLDACSDGYDPAARTKWKGLL